MEKKKTGVKEWFKNHIPTKRRIIQLYAALLTNANLKGFGSGYIYQGDVKSVCVPGLNCYSCPAASAACPLGALQNALASTNTRLPYYMVGILLLFGFLFGRWICGFLCPFGLIQDLLHKIKTPKIKKNRLTRKLSYLKYVILVVFVIAIPLTYALREMPFTLPAFCKYICPSGTLLGAGGLLSNEANEYMFSMLGPLFTWKFCLLVVFIVGAIFMYRFFCRFFCPLGAIYGLFNKISFLGMNLDTKNCVNCGLCVGQCEMDIHHVGDHECISCGKCVNVCPTGAISYKGPKILLAPNEVGGRPNTSDAKKVDPVDFPGTPLPKKTKIARGIVAGCMAALLAGSFVYYNFIDKDPVPVTPPPSTDGPTDVVYGGNVGDLCYDYEMPVYGTDETLKISDLEGKVVVINFWYKYCAPCVAELKNEFPQIADEYADEVTILTVHKTEQFNEDINGFIETSFPDYNYIFCRDNADVNGEYDEFYRLLNGRGAWPHTVILDEEGVIRVVIPRVTSYDELKTEIDKILAE